MTFMQPELSEINENAIMCEATVIWKNTKLLADPSERSRGTSVLAADSVPVANQAPLRPEPASNMATGKVLLPPVPQGK